MQSTEYINAYNCEECKKEFKKLTLIGTTWVCESCLIKAVLLIKPINFNKEFINNWLKKTLEDDEEICAQEGLSGEPFVGECQKFIDWVKPFLDNKE